MQTAYDDQAELGYHGQLAEGYPNSNVTGRAEAAVVQVGVVVVSDTAANRTPHAVRPPASSAEVTDPLLVLGLTRWDPTYPEPPYRLYASLPVLRRGRLYIAAETPLARGAPIFVRFQVGAVGTLLGALRGDDDAGKAVAAPYLAVVTSTNVRGFAVVDVRLA